MNGMYFLNIINFSLLAIRTVSDLFMVTYEYDNYQIK
jgi:hypothetical protein